MKKIYVEITNNCNLDCSFCIKNKRNSKFMSMDDFKIILSKAKPYTKYLYFHILGEPLMHPNINQFIDVGSNDFFINITTNGYLINRLKTNKVRQLNISLHSFDMKYNVSLEEYMNNIFSVVDKLSNTYISYRFWVKNKYSEKLLDLLNKHYNTSYNINNLDKSNKLRDNIFININSEFIWPDLNNSNYYSSVGKCYAIRDHIGILCDGTIVPCCLDSNGDINLGNIYLDNLEDVLNSKRVIEMLDGFKNNQKKEELCRKCRFLELDS